LPYGSTSGQRIVLDGVNGVIAVYDVNNDLLLTLDPEGFKVYDGDGNLRIWLAIPTGGTEAYSIIELLTTREDQTSPATISVYDTAARNRMVITAGENAGRGGIEWSLLPEDADMLKEAMLQAVCYTLDHADNLRPTIDLTGASSQVGKEPVTVVHDIKYGTPNAFGTTPTMKRSYPRGLVGFGSNSSDVSLSTTAGVFSTVVGIGDIPVLGGHWYKVTMAGGHSFVSGGSGFTVGDFWEFTLERALSATGIYDQLPGYPAFLRVRANVAIAARFPFPVVIGYYNPAGDSVIDFRGRATKGGGAATVTTGLGTNAGAAPFTLAIEHLGTNPNVS
jgi:hypothetical protein